MPSGSFKKIIVSSTVIIVVASIFLMLFLKGLYEYYLATPVDGDSKARINFSVSTGESAETIGDNLAQLDLILSSWAFKKYVKEKNLDATLEAGKYVLKKSYTIPEMVEFLQHSRTDEVALTIKEGLSLQEVDNYLADNGILPRGSFEVCAKKCFIEERFSFLDSKPKGLSLEGYLFPDTYFADPETVNPENLILRMLKNFDEKLTPDLRSEIAKRGYSIHQIVTMASLIEEESREPEEKGIIAGILWKRFEEKQLLGVDATIRYAVEKPTGPLTEKDLAVNSPYNTRKKVGLPPGPISNFGFESLKTAILPTPSEYYYYLHDNEGKVHFAKTNEEHNLNKERYLSASP